MNPKQEIRACAKINLHLEVFNKRSDGYHNILGLMAGVDLCDILKLEFLDADRSRKVGTAIGFKCAGGDYAEVLEDLPAEQNLVVRAARTYFAEAGISGRADFSLVKNIPSGAGLGGGSSDAAAALRLLNGEFGAFSQSGLERLGAMIGADVPYCLRGGFTFCEGIGEIMETVSGGLDHAVVIVASGIHVNTGEAYRALKRTTESPVPGAEIRERKQQIGAALEKGDLDPVRRSLKNDFEGPVFVKYPELLNIKKELYTQGAEFAAMTGSGSGMIGLFTDLDRARESQASWAGKYRAFMARFIH